MALLSATQVISCCVLCETLSEQGLCEGVEVWACQVWGDTSTDVPGRYCLPQGGGKWGQGSDCRLQTLGPHPVGGGR